MTKAILWWQWEDHQGSSSTCPSCTSVHSPHTCSCFLLVSRWSWPSTVSTVLTHISASAGLKSYKFLSFGQVSNCNDFIVFTLPTSRNFTTPSYFTIMREKPLLKEALWAASKRCIVQCLLGVTIWKSIHYFKSQHPGLTEETRTAFLNWKQRVLWYFDRALLGRQSSVTHSNADEKINWIFAVSLPTQFQVNKTVRKPLIFPLVCCQSSYDELFTNISWLPPDHTCSRALVRILPEKRAQAQMIQKVLWQDHCCHCGSNHQPNKNWVLLLWLTGHPRHWELKPSIRRCLPDITPTALAELGTAENANQDSRQSIHYLQAHSSWEEAASSASLAVSEMWRETMSCLASNSTGQQFMLKSWNNPVISTSP